MYRKSDERIFLVLTSIANVLVFSAFLFIALYHFYMGRIAFRNLSLAGLSLSFFFKFQVYMLKVYILEIRVSNLMDVGKRPGKIAAGAGNIAILIYSILFWLCIIGVLLSFMPADWRP